jgi:hypothetical protein
MAGEKIWRSKHRINIQKYDPITNPTGEPHWATRLGVAAGTVNVPYNVQSCSTLCL